MWLCSLVAVSIALVAVVAQPATPSSTLSSFFKNLILAQAKAAGQEVPAIAQGYLDTYRVREGERENTCKIGGGDNLTTALVVCCLTTDVRGAAATGVFHSAAHLRQRHDSRPVEWTVRHAHTHSLSHAHHSLTLSSHRFPGLDLLHCSQVKYHAACSGGYWVRTLVTLRPRTAPSLPYLTL